MPTLPIEDELGTACLMAPSLAMEEARLLFEQHAFFACHEVLEGVWRQTAGPLRELYRGLIQLAVGLYHAQRGNLRGARTVLRRGLERVQGYPAVCLGYDLATLCEQADRYLTWLEQGGGSPAPELPQGRKITSG